MRSLVLTILALVTIEPDEVPHGFLHCRQFVA